MAGYTGNNNLIASCFQYCIKVGVTGIALLFMDKFGRRPLLLFGATGMMVWQYVVAGLFATYSVPYEDSGNDTVRMKIPIERKPVGKAIITSCFLFAAEYALTWSVTIWVYCAEVWGDNAARQRGAAVSTSANCIFNFALAMCTPSSLRILHGRHTSFMQLFVFVCSLSSFFFPETKGKSLEEIVQMWKDKVPAWRTVAAWCSIPLR